MYKCILFDFDGTLVPSLSYWLDGFKHAFETLGHQIPDEAVIIERCFYRNDVDIRESFQLDCVRTFWSHVQSKIIDLYSKPDIFAGVRDVLEHCRANGIKLGVVTSAERAMVAPAMEALDITKYFGSIVTADDVMNYKPHAEPVLKALSELRAKASETLFVGDYVVDVQAGKAAGTSTAIFYTTAHNQFHKLEHLQAAEPDFFFSDYHQFLSQVTANSTSDRTKAGTKV